MNNNQSPSSLVAWFLIGAGFAAFLLMVQARSVGGVTGLISVGTESPLREVVSEQIDGLSLRPGAGHDGQFSYAIGLDLGADTIPSLLDHAGYRYRRILYPALGSLFGLLEGRALLYGLVAVSVASSGLAFAALASLSASLGQSRWLLVALVANPGFWLAIQLLTVDSLAMSLALVGVALLARRHHPMAAIALGLAALAKDQYVLIPLSVTMWMLWRRDRLRAAAFLIAGVGPLAVWSTYLLSEMPGAFSPRKNLGWPFVGIAEAGSRWGAGPPTELALGLFALFMLVGASVAAIKRRDTLIGWLLTPWVALGFVSSVWVWEFGNNAARALAVLAPLGALALVPGRDLGILIRDDALDVPA